MMMLMRLVLGLESFVVKAMEMEWGEEGCRDDFAQSSLAGRGWEPHAAHGLRLANAPLA